MELDFPDIKKLTNEESKELEGEILLKEASKTLFNMKSNKSPGSDGFTAEFFKVFWKKLGNFVVRSINYAYASGNLSVTKKNKVLSHVCQKGINQDISLRIGGPYHS